MRAPFQEPHPRYPVWPTRTVQIGGAVAGLGSLIKLGSRLLPKYLLTNRKGSNATIQKAYREAQAIHTKKPFHKARSQSRVIKRKYKKGSIRRFRRGNTRSRGRNRSRRTNILSSYPNRSRNNRRPVRRQHHLAKSYTSSFQYYRRRFRR